MRKTYLVQDYFICKTELIALRASWQIKLDNAIRRNRENPSEKLAELIDEINEMLKMLNRSLQYVINNDREQTQILMELSKAKVQILELRKELDKKH